MDTTPPESVRFRRVLLSDYYPPFDSMDAGALALYPDLEEEFNEVLMPYEIYLLASLYSQLKQTVALRSILAEIRKQHPEISAAVPHSQAARPSRE